MKIIFMGTSDFAVPTLEALYKSKHELVAVVSRPPAEAGRGQKITLSPVQKYAEDLGLKTLYPKSLRKEDVQKEIKDLGADIIVVAAYGNVLPKEVLEICKYGCLNVHPSLLPRWRGAAPVERTILAGDKTTAVCIMQIDEGLDTGDILMQQNLDVENNQTSESLRKITAEIGAKLILSTLENLSSLTPQKQKAEGITYADKLQKEEGKINWHDPVEVIDRKIRAFYPWPASYFEYKGEQIKIIEASCIAKDVSEKPGTVVDDQMTIACKNGVVQPKILQRSGKRAMSLKEFVNGFKMAKEVVLE
jgi:methionyl-tRNA formyltransferase